MTEENDTQWHIDAWRTKYEALLQERVAAEQGRWREVASLTHQLEQAVRERDEARAELVFLRAEYGDADANTLTRDALELKLQVMEQQRDEARAEVERLRVACDGCADSEAKTGSAHYADCPVSVIQAERDEARAEVEVLRRERDDLYGAVMLAEERGAEWAIRAKAQVVYSLAGDASYVMLAKKVCEQARGKR